MYFFIIHINILHIEYAYKNHKIKFENEVGNGELIESPSDVTSDQTAAA